MARSAAPLQGSPGTARLTVALIEAPSASPSVVAHRVDPALPTPTQSPTAAKPSAPPAPPVARASLAAVSGPASQPVVFYSFGEVDKAAFPESDWNLDVEALDALGLDRIAFEVLINEQGDIVGCTVLSPTDMPEDARRGLEQRLTATRAIPAQRAGIDVPSVRRIELVVAPPPLDLQAALAARHP